MPTMRPMPLNSGRIYAHSSDSDDYELAAKIGQGKYSEVFSGYNILNAKKVAVKLLKDVRLDKVRREAKILGLLSEGGHRGHNTLVEVCRERGTQKVLLVTEFIEGPQLAQIHTTLQEKQIQKYLCEILLITDRAHSLGIMHRDLKPSNTIVNRKTEELTILDWGLGEFYLPNKDYHVRVATKPYKAPELLLGITQYDYKIDVWAIGCILAGMLFRKEYMFPGKTDEMVLGLIVDLLGREPLDEYLDRLGVELTAEFKQAVKHSKKTPWDKLLNPGDNYKKFEEAKDLLEKMLAIDPEKRCWAKEALNHRYFDEVRDEAKKTLHYK